MAPRIGNVYKRPRPSARITKVNKPLARTGKGSKPVGPRGIGTGAIARRKKTARKGGRFGFAVKGSKGGK